MNQLTPYQLALLAAVETAYERQLERWPLEDFTDLTKKYHRERRGALTPWIASFLPDRTLASVRQELHKLKNMGLVEYYMPYPSTIRWFPVSKIPKS